MKEQSDHGYIKTEIIREKIRKDDIKKDNMKDPKFQKYYFIETFLQYPSLTYNEILVSLVNKFEPKKIYYTSKNFSFYKTKKNKPYIYPKSKKDILNEIKLYEKNLLSCYLKYRDIQTGN